MDTYNMPGLETTVNQVRAQKIYLQKDIFKSVT